MTELSVLAAGREASQHLGLIQGGERLSFGELAGRVLRRMQSLTALAQDPLRDHGLVALQTDETSATIEVLLALFELGRAVLPLHPRLAPRERERIVSEHPVAWVVEPREREIRLHQRSFKPDALASKFLTAEPQLAALSTSGTTGAPRVAVLSRRAFLASAAASASRLGWRENDRWLLALPVAHIGGLSVVTRCLIARRPIVLFSRAAGIQSNTERLAAAILDGAPTLLSLVPTQLDALLELGSRFELPSHVRAILVGGAATPQRLLEMAADRAWPVLTSYGMTEACSQIATQRPGTVNRGDQGAGPPLPGVRVELRDGIIVVLGPTLMTGYIGRDGFECDPNVGFRTRDLGRIDAEGALHVLGRVDDTIITGGENVHPAEVEAVLAACPHVLEACVFGVRDERWGQIVAAGLRVEARTSREDVLAAAGGLCERQLATFKRPRLYACVTDFVHGPTGKLDRAATAALLGPFLGAPGARP